MNGTDFRKDIFGSYISWHWRGSSVLLPVWRLHIVTIVAGAGRWQLESLDSEGEVLIIRVVDQEPVVDVLLQALGLIAWRDKGTGLSGCGALLNTCGLGQGLVVGLHSVDDDSPFSSSVDGSHGLDVGGDGGAEVGLLHNLLQSLHAVLSVGKDILVDSLDTLIVVLESMLDLVGGIFSILQAPSLGVSFAALWWFVIVWLGVGLGFMVRGGSVDSVVDWFVIRSLWVGLIGGGMYSVMHWDLMIDWGWVDYGGGVTGNFWGVDWGGVVHWLHWAVGRGHGAVAIHSGMVDRSWMVDSVVDRPCSIRISFGMD